VFEEALRYSIMKRIQMSVALLARLLKNTLGIFIYLKKKIS